jgi:hypothetical protein
MNADQNLSEILKGIIEIIKDTPNDQELGEKLRLKYWHELKSLSEQL